MIKAFLIVLQHDLTLAFRHRGELANPLLFFVIVVSLFPLALGPESRTLAQIAPGIIWVAALLVSLLALEGMFRSDFEDGTLEQVLLSPYPLSLLVCAKVLAHWLVTGLPLLIMSPLLAVLLHMPEQSVPALVVSLLLGTPVLSLVGAIGIALTVGLRRGGLLLSLLVLPLWVPVLIFAASAVGDAAIGLDISAQLFFLAAMLVLAITLAPLAIGAALKISVGSS